MSGPLADLIMHANFFGNRLTGFESVRGRILPFSYLQAVAVNTVLGRWRYRTACDAGSQINASLY